MLYYIYSKRRKDGIIINNNLSTLNNYLFEELENIQDLNEESSNEEMERVLRKAGAISKIAAQIISNGNLVLRAKELEVTINGRESTPFPKMLEG